MLVLGPIGFAAPWVLTALIALPVLWLILRAMPPAPRRVLFPGVALLQGLTDRDPVAQRTPWWLLLLRMMAIAALVLGLAGPVWKPVAQADLDDALLVILDAGWAAAPDWSIRQERAESALKAANSKGKPAALLIADGRNDRAALSFDTGQALLGQVRGAQPVAWPTTYPADPEEVLANLPDGRLTTLWISDGLDHPGHDQWQSTLIERGELRVFAPSVRPVTLALSEADEPTLLLRNAPQDNVPEIVAIGPDPQGIERELARFRGDGPNVVEDGNQRAIPIAMPPELRNRVSRFEIDGQRHAGAVLLADDRVRRRKVGLVGDADNQGEGQQLLSPLFYLRRALAPGADISEGGLGDVLDAAPDVVIVADQVDMADAPQLSEWVEEGGILIRFAGPRMAAYEDLTAEPLLPVDLRQGGRDIGGALSWGDPRGLLPFAADGIFAGLEAPADVAIRAQLMAQPSPELSQRTIASLSDNTPLVTRQRLGQGQVVLFHVTANPDWSNLPLSGAFVKMLERLVAMARVSNDLTAIDQGAETFWTPISTLDGFGRTTSIDGLAPVAGEELDAGPGPDRPAGIYGASERRRALNAGGPVTTARWGNAQIEQDDADPGMFLRGYLLGLAAILLAFDALGSALVVRGGRIAVLAILLALMQPATETRAQDGVMPDPELVRAADEVALAYVLTGDPATDQTSQEGLAGLSFALRQRTSVEPGEPIGIDLDNDDLALLTFLYWPVTDDQPAPSPGAYLRLNHFLRSGGMILFDTNDGDVAGVGGPDMSQALRRLAAPLEIPPLAPVPEDHVLTRTFYLLGDFPGRWDGNPVWVEAPPAREDSADPVGFRQLNDGVTPVVIGANGWAEAWAIDDGGYARFPVGRGWEGERQREMAFRFGINLIMYVLTGNYKSDQVHVPELLDRLRIEEGGGP
ncbi:DUF4159 domain-containing protein [Paracoccus sp. Z330]|uniref:DUF4159 domain-containing protein n=1 Tax=Paracoccus onchidii TaxID=3017813 RepID=A0ABT4ZHU0_9RHOB|nr:DUF4159 domain-containing protein [Paracoccus onchidii]MDB6178872.1 DUF4159 domain-containing protein [Paracoccus onchidii]